MQMERMVIQPPQPSPEIYIIFRVFKLGQLGMGMRMIVDPEIRRRRGELEFTAELFTVKQVEAGV